MKKITGLRGAWAPCVAVVWACACGGEWDAQTSVEQDPHHPEVPAASKDPTPDRASPGPLQGSGTPQPPSADVLWGVLQGGVAEASVAQPTQGQLTLESEAGIHRLKLVAPADQPGQEVMLWVNVLGGLDQPALAAGQRVATRREERRGRFVAWAYGCVRTTGNTQWEDDESADTVRILSMAPNGSGGLLLNVAADFPVSGTSLVATVQVPGQLVTPTSWHSAELDQASVTLNGQRAPVLKSFAMGDPGWAFITVAVPDGDRARVFDVRFAYGLGVDPTDGTWAASSRHPWVQERGTASGVQAPFRVTAAPEGHVMEIQAELPDGTTLRVLGLVDGLVSPGQR
jgi:hypothetical protein